MDLCGVEKATVIAISPHMNQIKIHNEINNYINRLYFVGSVDPWDKNSIEQIKYLVNFLGAKAIKLHPRLQKFSHKNISIINPIAQCCGDLGIPLIFCSFCGGESLYNSNPLELTHEVAVKNSATKIVIAHAGSHRPIESMLIQKSCSNIYMEFSFTPIYFRGSSVNIDLEFILGKCDPRKILYGSDSPEASMQDSIDWMLETLNKHKMPLDSINNIFFNNSIELFNIKP